MAESDQVAPILHIDANSGPVLPVSDIQRNSEAIRRNEIPIPENENAENSDEKSYSLKRGMGAPFKFQTPNDLQIAVDAYFANPDSKPWRMSGLAYDLGVSRVCLLDYKNRSRYGKIVERAKEKIEASIEAYLLEKGGPNPTGVIFNLHNNYAWRQKSEQDVNIGGQENNPIRVNVNFTNTKVAGPDGSQD